MEAAGAAEMKELVTKVIREYNQQCYISSPHCNPVSMYQLLGNLSASLQFTGTVCDLLQDCAWNS